MTVSDFRQHCAIAIGAVCALMLVGCAASGVNSGQGPEITYKREAYVIGIGDQLRVDVWRNQELTRELIVRPDGQITMPLMGDMQAEGETPEELAAAISNELGVIIISPEVSVTVTNPVSVAYQYRVRAMGQVNEPVSIAFVDGMTVVDLVLAAGGISPFGAGNRAVLNRDTPDGYVEYPVRLDDILNKGDIRTNYPLQPSDILTVPEKSVFRGEL
ncbi:XrtA/PEP-CTERM system exopolysaccharide export protein [Saccharospirillum impatiens]|uniref:XrtA/PEP-CTERM system exopolysaccharide export protein n=1 Tax=Saccharospirillum impatiens TaxID=169438 RepID=UPI00040C1D39|nr:XrtA/PEP-CTERM system exopolysaccharide export protein [Saccharospirillum impatiens]